MKLIKYEDALKAVTKNLDRINCVAEGTMRGVAGNWLKNCKKYNITPDIIKGRCKDNI